MERESVCFEFTDGWLSRVLFPLTPALSRRERENCAPFLVQITDLFTVEEPYAVAKD
jgi:hypothetical protein